MLEQISGKAARRLIHLGVAVAVLLQLGASALAWHAAASWHDVLTTVATLISGLTTIGLASWAMAAQISETTDVAADELRRQIEKQRTEMLEQTRRENIRQVHDTLLHLFQQIASGRGKLTRKEVKKLTHASRAGIGDGANKDPDSSPLVASLEHNLRQARCPVKLKVHDRGALPGRVTRVMSEAAREAARNVARHVPGATAHVKAVSSPEGCTIVISDWGPGFDPQEVSRARMGIRDGIRGRMAEIGGTAEVVSDVSGTQVTLTWKPIPHAVRFGPVGRRYLSFTPIPAVAASMVSLAVCTPGLLSVIGWILLAVTGALLLVISRILQRRGLRVREATVAVVWAVLMLIGNHVGTAFSPICQLWTVPIVGALLVLATPGREWRAALAMTSGVLLTAALGSFGLLGGPQSPLGQGSLMPLLVSSFIAMGLVMVISVLAQRAHKTEKQRTDALVAEELHVARVREQQRWLAELERICGPLFSRLHTGAADPEDLQVRSEARHVESQLRDALRMWPDGMKLASALDRLRRSGWGCMLDIEQIESEEAIRLADTLGRLEGPEDGQHLTITRRQGVLMATVAEPGLTESQRALLIGARILLTDPDFTQFVCEEERP